MSGCNSKCKTCDTSTHTTLKAVLQGGKISCETSGASSGFLGAMHGLAGLFGAGGFWDLMDDSELKNLQDQYKQLLSAYNACESACKGQIDNDQRENYEAMINEVGSNQSLFNETLSEKLEVNFTLTIFALALIVLIVVFLLTEKQSPESIFSSEK